MYYTLKQVSEIFKDHRFLYKGKTTTLRTVKTMAENGLFLTLKFCECGQSYIVSEAEINEMVAEEC